ncbi:MAG: hypothetical protein QM744_04340 [Mesorhizobium sp.]
MHTIFDILEKIEKLPGLYIGRDPSQRAAQLQDIEMLIYGYALAIDLHNIDEPGKDFSRQFSNYLFNKYKWSQSCGPVAAIREAAGDDDKAWDMLWRLIREYRTSIGL